MFANTNYQKHVKTNNHVVMSQWDDSFFEGPGVPCPIFSNYLAIQCHPDGAK
jgi:hypothetical protein